MNPDDRIKRQRHGQHESPMAAGEGERSGTSETRRREMADFLRTRREKLKPEHVGITSASRRRTPGLRREEVAELAGVGTTWYTWLEQARDIQPSSDVLRRLARALRMTTAEMRHLFTLAGKAVPNDLDAPEEVATPSLLTFIEKSLQVPAIILGARWDILAINKTGQTVFPNLQSLAEKRVNWLNFYFGLLPKEHIDSWENNARRIIAEFRASVGESLDLPWVTDLVESLRRENPDFDRFWKEHDVRDNAPTIVELEAEGVGRRMKFERIMLRSLEDPRLKVLIFSPVE